MKDITPIPKEIFDTFQNSAPQYLVVGIARENIRSIPPRFKNVSFHVGTLDELHTAIINEGLQRFTVFSVNGTFSNEGQLKNDAEKFAKEQEEMNARKAYEQLKARFETKMEVVE